jgi:hypothetical protein
MKKVLISVTGSAVVLWQLLLSGYVLTLDMVFGPRLDYVGTVGDLVNTAPVWGVLKFLTAVVGGVLTQKILLLGLFFILFYLPLHFLPRIWKGFELKGAEYIGALIFAINPFVYERFLAGHWMVLVGYALLVPLTSYVIEFCSVPSYRSGAYVGGTILLIGAVSTHFLIIGIILVGLVSVVRVMAERDRAQFIRHGLLVAFGVFVISLYWVVPALNNHGAIVYEKFGPEHWEVFKTVGGIGNVLALKGFWGEREYWAGQFVMPGTGLPAQVALVGLALLVAAGVWTGLRSKETRKITYGLLGVAFIALVFSTGIGDTIFKGFNTWMFEHISFWKGFRDSQKWSGVLALIYTVLGTYGTYFVVSRFTKHRRIVLGLLALIPLVYTPSILFGFSGQLHAVHYPAEWSAVNEIMQKDSPADTPCRALFLPWHQYYTLKFNNNILTGNVSRAFFDCDVIHGKNMELGSIESQGGNGEEYEAIETMVTNPAFPTAGTLGTLRGLGIRWIIYTNDVEQFDQFSYPFLQGNLAEKRYSKNGIDLYYIK